MIELRNTSSNIMKNTTNTISATHCAETNNDITSQFMTGNKLR